MLKKKFTKLIGLSYENFIAYIASGEITAQQSRLIPLLKTGDEGALASIFLSSLRLVKEYRDSIFKELKISRGGKAYYLTEVVFKTIDEKSRIDGLVFVVSKGVISEAVIFEMKNKNNSVDKGQIDQYIGLSKKIGVKTLCTISNEFVSDSRQSPVNAKPPKNFSLFHFSWTYLMTKGQLLLFKNESNIKDEDQVEIMREVLHYMDSPNSGVSGYNIMKSGWKETVEKFSNRIPLKTTDSCLLDAVESWHEEEKDMGLLLSRKLGVYVKSTTRSKDSVKNDIKKIINDQELLGSLSIKNSVSDIQLRVDFEVKTVSMSVKVSPPMDKGTKARITWIAKQLESAKKKNEAAFALIEKDLLIEANIKHAREHIRVPLSKLDILFEQTAGREVQAFNILYMCKFGAGFGSQKKFIVLIEKMVLNYYAGIVQYLTNWNRPAPRL